MDVEVGQKWKGYFGDSFAIVVRRATRGAMRAELGLGCAPETAGDLGSFFLVGVGGCWPELVWFDDWHLETCCWELVS